ncbi:zinc finger protein ZAT11 [Manihot esculenta]|uniref:Uncharacterized protein n=2 Tax=Manihot esculenta TaxID=3983 RepID=A0ACB7HC40_MANES|nr:zinc finger protein ZAT11 [Manihot esculenta]KAG8649248.1 hypothetical protein MANES_08G076885v8 [Manihot esculenta]
MKRTRDSAAEMERLDMAKCLILLSHTLHNKNPRKHFKSHDDDDNHLFECKTCNKKFPSFQALGGHRASHKKPKMATENKPRTEKFLTSLETSTVKTKVHECSICGVEFALGQALGGHMRRHRAAMTRRLNSSHARGVSKLPVLRRSTSSKRVFGLDLNLTPLENDLQYLFGKMAPKVDPFI